uniref:Uncharacterized protein n=1 Tax=Solanum tuberosum TaxID=4113 RepID=M1ACV9_SOLTU
MSAVYPLDAKFESLRRPKNLEKLHASRMTFHSFFIGVGGSIEIPLLEDSDSKNVFFLSTSLATNNLAFLMFLSLVLGRHTCSSSVQDRIVSQRAT